jgi:hypothetical protein
MLNKSDFLIDQDFDNNLICEQHDFHVNYTIEMSKLAVICESYEIQYRVMFC